MEAAVIKATQMKDIMAYNSLSTPGLLMDEKVVSSGRVPSKAEIVSMLATALSEAGA